MPNHIQKLANGKIQSRGAQSRLPVELVHGDAFEFLSELKADSVDLIIASPPYFMGKEYEKSSSIEEFKSEHIRLLPLLVRALKSGGSICWQVGNHVKAGTVIPLDAVVYGIFADDKELKLRNRIVWTFGHGVHASKRFSGRHESILWFTKGADYFFNLDAVRVPQKYPGKRHYKGPKKGEWSGNPAGKNPSDVWDIPNVKSSHIEKTAHPCQFPVGLVQRCIRAMTPPNGVVVDPFMGSGSTALASAIEGRKFIGCDKEKKYVKIAQKRIGEFRQGKVIHRPLDKPIVDLPQSHSVATRPPHFSTI
ncbi:DNA-methyltransferase [Bradyrhizobium erythrophlei]|uniref:Methyltransferase n=1 Tax=Bradyrhizobium erythrophlei TaxID=1437360 RepID=A0A1M5PY77_9BRAD|nr:site-specific DNA-methyltransferase [Bradyrhizobium erythrophlei]SHH06957.1 adenine-specific DNA-methyltransferase [Bradyrhizobium erythrophlei]